MKFEILCMKLILGVSLVIIATPACWLDIMLIVRELTLESTSPLPNVTAILESVVDPSSCANEIVVEPALLPTKLMVAKVSVPIYK